MDAKITDAQIKHTRENLVMLSKKVDIEKAKIIKDIIEDVDKMITRLALAETNNAVKIAKNMNLHPMN